MSMAVSLTRVLERQGDVFAARQFRAAMESFMLTVSECAYQVELPCYLSTARTHTHSACNSPVHSASKRCVNCSLNSFS